VGVDIDPGAIATARVNAKANNVEDFLELGVGSLAELHDGVFSISKAPVVLANILAPILDRLLDEGLGELVEPGGILLLSGILDEQVERVKVAIERNGLQVVFRHTLGDWAILGAQPAT
jgi:ribosomal protein L11 methyltransferase